MFGRSLSVKRDMKSVGGVASSRRIDEHAKYSMVSSGYKEKHSMTERRMLRISF